MTDENPTVSPDSRLQKIARTIGWIAGGILFGALVTLIAVRQFTVGGSLPPLDADTWRAAKTRWNNTRLDDYRIAIRVSGRQPATYAVSVRGGVAVEATRDGLPLPQERTWSTWTVDGMFETIARDLDSIDRHARGSADASTPQLQLRGSFEPHYGYPKTYLRTEMVRIGANPEVSWEVISFEPGVAGRAATGDTESNATAR